MLNELYVVINQLIKSIWKVALFKNKTIIHVKGKKIMNPTKNDKDWDFWK
jgi:hypothetical protein